MTPIEEVKNFFKKTEISFIENEDGSLSTIDIEEIKNCTKKEWDDFWMKKRSEVVCLFDLKDYPSKRFIVKEISK
jgi:hypothetical protein